MANSEFPTRFDPKDFEERIYKFWIDSKSFTSEDKSTKPPYCIVLPPPNVTGSLHLGHALDQSIQDVLIRWKRMSGFNTLYLPGTDHAGIATQSVVEKNLKKEGKTRKALGRVEFETEIWKWKETYADRIRSQMRRLGGSFDWSRERFTLDEGFSAAVRKVFVDLYKKQLIYRGERLVNWDVQLETAVSDLEVEHRQEKGSLWHIKYPIEGSKEFLTIATTRPETLLGDTAVCVHPDDERYQKFAGKNVILPLLNKKIPILQDSFVDKSFGSGAVKITPAHDFTDYEVGKRHDLPMINILNIEGTLNENAGPYKGLKIDAARKKIVEDLTSQGLLVKEETHQVSVPVSERSGVRVEPFLSKQWFVRIDALATGAKRVVESGTVRFVPDLWTKTYLHWMNNIQDWCISRQLWWGHRIPAWYCQGCQHVTISEKDPTQCEKCGDSNIKQDEDVLDTWFSSGLWPFGTLGWPEKTESFKTFYPTSVLVTGHDIIFFWVARMIMQGLYFIEDVPFRTVYIHGLIRDSQGKKMSKSIGNTVDPLEMIEKYGADALRFTLIASLMAGRDLKFSEQRLEGHRNFITKVWNAARFLLSALEENKDLELSTPTRGMLSNVDQWILQRLKVTCESVDRNLNEFRLSDAANTIYDFIWHDFCDWYVEMSKAAIYGNIVTEKGSALWIFCQVLERALRLLHPFAPFVTEEIYQRLPFTSGILANKTYPGIASEKDLFDLAATDVSEEIAVVKDVITAVRNIRGENRISPAIELNVVLVPQTGKVQKLLGNHSDLIKRLARVGDLAVQPSANLAKCAVATLSVQEETLQVAVPLEGLVDFNEEIKRVEKQIEKIQKEQSVIRGKLDNEKYLANAPEELVNQDKQRLVQIDEQVLKMNESLGRLRG
ncbi:MAG: valine--tRNA ligase [Bdellovibrionales bacterium CG10_big_fil_rev_8_21_14_0_10_45_34]|nr:MAG: valine--tRNA ligase [Bdellovibrionales bacterium CG10_big_fil_rev_8_21_14_0_10_45_34]